MEETGRRRVSTSSDSEISDGWNLIDAVEILPTEISDAESVEVLHEEFTSEIETQGNVDNTHTDNRVSEIGPTSEPSGSSSIKELFEVSAVLAVLVAVALSSSYMLLALEDGFYAVKPALLDAILPSKQEDNNQLALSVETLRLENRKLHQKLMEIDTAYSSLKMLAIERYQTGNLASVIPTQNVDKGESSVDVSAGNVVSTDSAIFQHNSKDFQKIKNSDFENNSKYRLNYLGDSFINTKYVINIISAFNNLPGADNSIRLLHDLQNYFDIIQVLSNDQINKQFVDKWEKKFLKFSDNLKLDVDNMLSKLVRHVNRTIVSVQTKFILKLCNRYMQEDYFKHNSDDLMTSRLKEICPINNLSKTKKEKGGQNLKAVDKTLKRSDKMDQYSSSTTSDCFSDECRKLKNEAFDNQNNNNLITKSLHDAGSEVKKNQGYKKDKKKPELDNPNDIQGDNGSKKKHKKVDPADERNKIMQEDNKYETKKKRNEGENPEGGKKKDVKKHNEKEVDWVKVNPTMDCNIKDNGKECKVSDKKTKPNHEYESTHQRERNSEFINKEYKNKVGEKDEAKFDKKNLNKMAKTEMVFEEDKVEKKFQKENKYGDHFSIGGNDYRQVSKLEASNKDTGDSNREYSVEECEVKGRNKNEFLKNKDEENNKKKNVDWKKFKMKDNKEHKLHNKNRANNDNWFTINSSEELRNSNKMYKKGQKYSGDDKNMYASKNKVTKEKNKIEKDKDENLVGEKRYGLQPRLGEEDKYTGGKQYFNVGDKYENDDLYKRGELQKKKGNDHVRNGGSKKKNGNYAFENKYSKNSVKKKEIYGKASFKNKYNSSSDTWFLSMGKLREHLRFENHRSDWWFDRARARQGNKRETSNWFFDRAWVRHRCRMNPQPAWCNSQANLPKDIFSSNTFNMVR